MSNGYEEARGQRNILERLGDKIPGYRGFQDRELRRDVDRLQREHLASELGRLKSVLRERARDYTDAGKIGVLSRFDRLDRQLDGLSQAVRFSDYGATGLFDPVKIGDAEDIKTITRAGINESSLVILSTNDDAVNIYLAVYCRRLNPDVRIVSRATHERNREAMHRAGADFVLSYANLGAETILSLILGRDPVLIGGGVEFFNVRVPRSLAGLTLADSRIGALTGLIVLAIDTDGEKINNPPPSTVLPEGAKLTLLGTTEQWGKFNTRFD